MIFKRHFNIHKIALPFFNKSHPKCAVLYFALISPALADLLPLPQCDVLFRRMAQLSSAVGSSTPDLVKQLRWARQGTLKLYERNLAPTIERLLLIPLNELSKQDYEWLSEVSKGMSENIVLESHPDLTKLKVRLKEYTQLESFIKDPWKQVKGANRALKGWDRLSLSAKVAFATAIMNLQSDPNLSSSKVGFPNHIRFYGFNSQGVQYRLAFQIQDGVNYYLAVGPHENFYRSVNDLRQ